MSTLIIAEKPDAAEKIASALADSGTLKEHKKDGVRYYELKKNNEGIIVSPAVGHLFVLKHVNGKGWTYPIFENEWVPTFEADKKALFTKKYYKNMEALAKKADKFIVATDWDIEGSVIAYNILRFICNRKEAERMYFTTLTKEELLQSFENKRENIDMGMINAGLARHHLDWMYGINLTRALTICLKKARGGGFKVLSTGRVQGPTLKMLTDKEDEIGKFIPMDYWDLSIIWNKEYLAEHEKDKIFDFEAAKKIEEDCRNEKTGTVKSVTKKEVKLNPPVPFNLTNLQTEAYKQFKYNPYNTQKIAQKLYTSALISYPRTSSQKLPEKIGYAKIIGNLKKQEFYKRECSELLGKKYLKPFEGKKDDQAHTAIHPTGEAPHGLTIQDKNVYDLIVRRFLSCFAEDAIKNNTNIKISVKDHVFVSNGSIIIEKGWMKYYGKYALTKEFELPDVKEGEIVSIDKVSDEKKQTLPPNRYTQAGIVAEMEKRDIGTKATRADVVKTLEDRGYITGESITVTKLGIGVIRTLEKFCPKIISEDLTRHFEKLMDKIQDKKETKEEVMSQAEEIIIDISNTFKDNEEVIGKELNAALEEMWKEQSNVGKVVGKCRKCGSNLIIMYSKKNGQEFVGCSNYPKCTSIYSLPRGVYEFSDKTCTCGSPIVKVGKKGFECCLEKNCKTRIVGECPECKNALRLMFSNRGSRFVGCSNYPNCKKLYGLNQKDELKFTEKKCKKCGSPIILINDEESCINKECEH
ncbi:Reverse gyrase [Candidatus Tiddalikarchaeum anstoanum]|nr:Reverse gyrase [Candidatus Tiddalikarchaeum anstoanum]